MEQPNGSRVQDPERLRAVADTGLLDSAAEEVLAELAGLVAAATEARVLAAERLRAVQALRDLEAKFKAFVDHSPAVNYIKDEVGRLLYANEAMYRYYPEARAWLGRLTE